MFESIVAAGAEASRLPSRRAGRTLAFSLLALLALFARADTARAAATSVYHERSAASVTNGAIATTCGGFLPFTSPLQPSTAQAVTIHFLVEAASVSDAARVYYTTDGSAPDGALGFATAPTLVIEAAYVCTITLPGGATMDVCSATIPAQPYLTQVRYIIGAWQRDSDDIEVFASGTATSAAEATVFEYTVASAPFIVTPPAPRTNFAGTAASFTVTAGGTEPFAYQWFFNGTNLLSDATNATLSLPVLATNDAGGYSVVVTNAFGAVTSAVALLVVYDTTPPAIVCAPPQTLDATPGCTAALPDFTGLVSAVSSHSPPVTVAQSPPPGAALPIGAHTITFTATDAVGNATNCATTVTVRETVPPSILCPANLTNKTANPAGASVTFAPAAADNCAVASVVCAPASGGVFPIGVTPVTCVATDSSGNTNACSFLVTMFLSDGTNFTENVVVPDASIVGVARTRTVSSLVGILTDVNVTLHLTNGWNGDLYAYLVHDSGFSVLLNRAGRRAADPVGYGDPGLDVTFDDDAALGDIHSYRFALSGDHATPLGGSLTNVWAPDGRAVNPLTALDSDPRTALLASFNGVNPNGEWTLFIADLEAGDQSTLVSWGLEFCGLPPIPPSIDSTPAGQSLECSSNLVLAATVSGTGPLTNQWRVNGAAIAGANSPTLSLSNVHPSDSGDYTLVLCNMAGCVTSAPVAVTITDTIAPTISVCATNLTACPDSSGQALVPDFTGQVVASDACGGLVVTQSPLAGATVASGTHTVTLTATDGAGLFATCTASFVALTNAAGTPLTPLALCLGSPAAFGTVASGTGPFTYQWTKDGAAIPDATNDSFSLPPVSAADAGTYCVIVSGACGSATNCATLTVLTNLSATTPADVTFPVPGTMVSFTTVPSGSGPFIYQWSRNGTAIPDSTNATHVIPAVAQSDEGAYCVAVVGACGSVTNCATLTVALPPVITAAPEKRTVFQGDSYTFTVAASGTGPLFYHWLRDGVVLPGETNTALALTNIQPAAAGLYAAFVTNIAGAATSAPAMLVVRGANDPRYPAPQGGWAYLYEGNAASNTLAASLDGTWNRQNGLDTWDGFGRGAGNGLPGGVEATNGVLTIEDAIGSNDAGAGNRRFYFTRDLNQDTRVTNQTTILNDGITLTFRGRLTPPTDPVLELTNAPNGWVNTNDGKGLFGIRQAGSSGLLISFSLNRAVEDISTNTTFTFAQPGLHMNNLSFNARSSFVDPGEAGSINLLPLDPAAFHEFWITIQDNGAAAGTHAVTIYLDGARTGTVFNVTAGLGSDAPFTNYLALGLGHGPQRGAVDIDFFGYAAGVLPPPAFNEPVGFTLLPTNVTRALGEIAVFNCGVTGTPPHSFQWHRNGAPIAGATNSSYTTPPMTAGDDGALFTVVVTNDCNAITSAPPAVLFLLRPPDITAQPQSLTVTNGDAAAFSVTVFSPATPSYQWRFNGANLPAETGSTLNLAAVSPASAGGYDVVITNAGGATTSTVAVLTVRVLDFGDALGTSIPTLRADNGARHVVVSGVHLGALIDFELDATPNAAATGDDITASDDEDGVSFTSPLRAGQVATVEVVASTSGVLDAWLDFNRDGSWAQAGEQVFTNRPLAAGTNLLTFVVAPGAGSGAAFARFRFSSAGGLSFSGAAADGEVEDHQTTLIPVADLVVTQSDAPDPVAVGSNLTWTITVSNAGPSAASAIAFTNALPAGVVFVSATSGQGSCAQNGGEVSCALGGLASGAAATVTIIATPSATGLLTNHAIALAAEIDLALASNSASEATAVLAPPDVLVPPQNLIVTNGSPATFSVTAAGEPPLSYQWRRGGGDLAGETNATFTIPSAQPADAGGYSVRVANSVGVTESLSATLTVLVPPSIVTQPQSRTNLAGSTATFSVAAAGTEPFSYQWFFNGTNALPDATNAVLSLANVQSAQAGAYHAETRNAAGVAASAAAMLTVIEMDFGDAADPSHPTLLVSDGARHRIVPGVHLGATIDFEPDGQPDSTATGDGADEDGVAFLSPVLVGQIVQVTLTASTNGQLDAWLDFNRSGAWTEAGEQIFTNLALTAGANSLQFVVPLDAVPGAAFARFRFSTAGGLSFTGEAADGEVEDYAVTIGAAVNLVAAKLGPVAPVVVGSNVTFTLHITNAGPSSATGATLADTLPAGLSFVSASASEGGCAHDTGVVTCALGTLASNGFASVTIEATVSGDGSLTNSALASSVESELVPADNAAQFVIRAFFPPAITAQPASLTVTNGDPAAFAVGATGTALHYQWRHGGVDVPGATNATLAIAAASTNDAGSYTVLVGNEVGSVLSAPATLTVLVPATIITQPQSLARVVGETAVFTVAVLGTEPLTYQWSFNGNDLPGETAATLTLADVQAAQAGLYRVRVENMLRLVMSDAALLTVYVPPAFTTQPQGRTNFAGGTATFAAVVTGTEPLAYQWLFNDAPLAGENAAALTLTNVQPAQAGAYALLVTNLGGAATSAVATLTVIAADFADAPEMAGYPTRLVFNGAWHAIAPGVHLGAGIDFEPDGQPDSAALGDDAAGTDDEDGVAFTAPLFLGYSATVEVTASTNGFIDAWIDFSANGSWLEPGEQIFASQAVTTGVNVLTFPVPADAVLTNTFARFRFSTAGGLPFDGPASDGEVEDHAVTVLPSFDLAVTMAAWPEPVLVESNVVFALTVTNRGPSAALDVVLTNRLPAGMNFLSVTASQGGCTNAAGQVNCALGPLAAGHAAQVLVELQSTRAGRVVASASIAATGNDVDLANNFITRTSAVVAVPASFTNANIITVGDADGNGPGLGVPYPSVVTVNGLTGTVFKVAVTLHNVSHTFPGDFDMLLVGPGGQRIILMSDAGGDIDMADVTVTFDDDAETSLPNSGVISSTAYRPTNLPGESDDFPPPAPAAPHGNALAVFRDTDPNGDWSLYVIDDVPNDLGSIAGGWSLDITTVEPIANLAVALTAPAEPVGLGSNITFIVTITNRGPSAATGLQFTSAVPPGVTFVSAGMADGSCALEAGLVRCASPSLNPFAAAAVTIVLRADATGLITNDVSIAAAQVDFLLADNAASAVVSVLPVNNLVLTHAASTNRVVLGESLTYTLAVTNHGPALAAHVVLTDALPAGVNVLSITSGEAACTNLGSTVLCDFGALAPGAGGSVLLVVEPLAAGFATNVASVASDEIDSAAADNASQIITPVNVAADLVLAAVTAPNPIAATSNLTLSVTVTNHGPSAAAGVRLAAPLPDGTVFVSAASSLGDCTNDAGVVRCALGSVAAGEGAAITILLTPLTPGMVTNLVSLESDSFDFTPADNGAALVTAVEQAPVITAGPESQTVLNGATVTFTIAAFGYAPLGYQWQLDGGDLANATNASLTLTGVTPAEQGSYRVRVANPVGAVVSTAAVLRVLVPPTISDVADVTVDEDQSTALLAVTIGDFETAAGALNLTATSSDTNLVPLANIFLGGADSNRTVQVLPATNRFGSALITLEVRDADGVVALDTFLLTVTPVDDPPALSPLADAMTDEDTAISIPFAVSDAENEPDSLNIAIASGDTNLIPAGALLLAGAGTNRVLTILPVTNLFGNAPVTVTVTDTNGNAVSNTFLLTVAPVNDPPTLDPIADVALDEDAGAQAVNFAGLGRGAENEPFDLSFTVTSSAPSIIPHPTVDYTNGLATGVLRFTPAPDANGSAVITVEVSDGGASNNLVTRTFTVTVNAVNDPPSITDIGEQSTPEDTTLAVSFTIADLENAASELALAVACSDTNLVPLANFAFDGVGAARQLLLLAATNQHGSAIVTITVTDTNGATASDSFLLVVSPVNDVPTLNAIADLQVTENSGLHVVALGGIGSGAANETQTLAVTAVSSDPTLFTPLVSYTSADAFGSLSFAPALNRTGAVVVTVTVQDGAAVNPSVSRDFTVNVIAIDHPPALSALADAATREDEPVAVPFSVTDAENDPAELTFAASCSDTNLVPPAGLSITGAGAVRLLHLAPATNASGSATVTLTVTDTNGGSASRSFTLVVLPVNDPPALALPAGFTTTEDAPLTLAGLAVADVDSDPGTVVLAATSSNPALIASSNIVFAGAGASRDLTLTPQPDQFGDALITITATDAGGASTTRMVPLTVVPVNDPPALAAIGDVTANENAGTRSVALSGLSAGPANESQFFSFSAVSSDPQLVTGLAFAYVHPQATGTLNFALAPSVSGTATVTVTVDDGGASNNVATRMFTVTVNAVDDPPVISELADATTAEDTARVLSFNVGDDTTPAAELALVVESSNTNLIPAGNISFGGSGSNRTVMLLPATNQSGGATITLTVTDTNGLNASRSFALTVEPVNDAPTITDVADQTVSEDTNGVSVAFTIGDLETAAEDLVVTAQSSDPQLIPDAALVLGGSHESRTLTFTPVANATGTATITLTVRDAGGLAASDTFLVTVNAANDPPFLSDVPDSTMTQDGTLGLPFVVGDLETAASNLVVTVSSSNTNLVPPGGLVLGGVDASRTLAVTPAPGATGVVTLTLTVDDGAATASDTFTLTVTALPPAPPTPPAITAQPQSVSVAAGGTAVFSVTATGNPPLAWQWRLGATNVPGATNATLTISNAQSGNAGNYTVVITNIAGAITSTVATLTIQPPNQPPVIAGLTNSSTINEDTTLVRAFTVTDPDLPAFRLALSATSSNATLIAGTNIFFDGNGTNRLLILTPATNQFGTSLITVTVSDGAATRSNAFLLTVSAVNDPPTLNPLPDVLVDGAGNPPAQNISLTGISSGAANESQTLAVTAASANTALVPTPGVTYTSPNATGSISFDAGNNSSGSSLITVTVNDGAASNNVTTRSFTAFYQRNNTLPTITAIGNQTINEDTSAGPLAFTVGDSATPVASLTLRATSSNPALIPTNNIVFGGSGANRNVTLTPLPNQSGISSITIQVIDGGFAFAATTFTLTVNPSNDVPAISGVTNLTIAANTSTPALPFRVSDVETPAALLAVSAQSSDTVLAPLSGIVFGGSGTNRAVMVTPAAGRAGSATITLTVTDASGGAASTNFVLTVTGSNMPPTIAGLAPVAFSEDTTGGPFAFTIGDDFTPAGSLTLRAASTNAALLPTNNIAFGGGGTSRTVALAPVANQFGRSLITITVTDGAGLSSAASFLATVNPVNDPPALDALADVVMALGDAPLVVSLTGIGPGAAGESQLLAVSAASANTAVAPHPAVAYASPSATGTLTLAPRAVGSAVITVTVNDGGPQDAFTTRSFNLTVTGPPSISAVPDQQTNEDTPTDAIPFTISDTETAATNLSVTVASSDTNLLPLANATLAGTNGNRTLTLLPATNQSGSCTVTLTVTDAQTNSVSTSFAFVVLPVNDPPTLDAQANLALVEDAGMQTVALTGITSGAADEVQSLAVTALSDNPALVPHPVVNYSSPAGEGSLQFTPAPDASGVATITVIVSDGHASGGSVTQAFTVTVTATNDLPVLSPIAAQSTPEDTPLLVGFLVGDVETSAAALALSATSSDLDLVPPGNIVLGGAGAGRAVLITPAANRSGSAFITITVADADGGASSNSFLLTVGAVNDPPSLAGLADAATSEDTPTAALAFTIGDDETAPGALLLSAASSDETLVPTNNIVFSGSGEGRTVTILPATNRFGSATITVTVTDGAGASASASFLLTVNAAPDAPVISDVADFAMDGNASSAPVAITVGDLETPAENLNLSASSSNPGLVPAGGIVFSGAGSNRLMVITPVYHQTGSAVITVTVTDGDGSSASDTFVLTVNGASQAPIILTSPTNRTVLPGATVSFSVTALGAAPLSYQWQRDGLDLTGETNAVLTLVNVQPSDAAAYRVRVDNTNGSAISASAVLRVIEAPVITAVGHAGGLTTISFTTVAGASYTVEFKDEVTDTAWGALPAVTGTGGVMSVIDTGASGPRRIYRVRAE